MPRYFSAGERRGLTLLAIVMAVTTAIALLSSESGESTATESIVTADTVEYADTAAVKPTRERVTKSRRAKKSASRKTAPAPRRSPLDEPF